LRAGERGEKSNEYKQKMQTTEHETVVREIAQNEESTNREGYCDTTPVAAISRLKAAANKARV
jgi:hypothetical protein